MKTTTKRVGFAALLAAAALSGCRQDMHDQPKFQSWEATDFFADGRASRPQVAGAVARGELRADTHLYEGRVNGELAALFPIPVTRDLIERGRERYEIFCSPCHGLLGDGAGTIVQRGFQAPPSYHITRLRVAPVGHFYDVISNGKGKMFSFNDRVPVRDRWAIVSYIRALQLSQATPIGDLPEGLVSELRGRGLQ